MQAVRILSMLLLVGWQAVGGDLHGMLRVCRMQAALTAQRECHCPHGKQKQQETSAALSADCCDTLVQKDVPPAVVVPPRTTPLPALAVEVPDWTLAARTDEVALSELRLRDVRPSQGPPLFLKIQTLLI